MRDLILVMNYGVSSSAPVLARCNSDTGSNYFYILTGNTGSSLVNTSSGGADVQINIDADNSTNSGDRVQTILQFFEYSQTNKQKGFLIRKDNPNTRGTYMLAGRYGTTSAITSITIYNPTFIAGSTFSLYGIEG